MPPLIQFLFATFLFMLIHVSVMALCAHWFNITIRSISYGVGPTLFSIDKAQFKLFPFAGKLVLKERREHRAGMVFRPPAHRFSRARWRMGRHLPVRTVWCRCSPLSA